ncbi:MAG: hypothetical protein ACJ71F_21260 [Nitrososphaeraceae archaeon]
MIKMHGLIGWDLLESSPNLTPIDSVARVGKKWLVWMEVRTP